MVDNRIFFSYSTLCFPETEWKQWGEGEWVGSSSGRVRKNSVDKWRDLFSEEVRSDRKSRHSCD